MYLDYGYGVLIIQTMGYLRKIDCLQCVPKGWCILKYCMPPVDLVLLLTCLLIIKVFFEYIRLGYEHLKQLVMVVVVVVLYIFLSLAKLQSVFDLSGSGRKQVLYLWPRAPKTEPLNIYVMQQRIEFMFLSVLATVQQPPLLLSSGLVLWKFP